MSGEKWSNDIAFPEGGVAKVGDKFVGLRAGGNFKADFPGDGIQDENGNYLIKWATIGGSATDYLQFQNSQSGTPTSIEAQGDSTNISINIVAKGSGIVNVSTLFSINSSTQINAIIDDDTMALASNINVPTSESVVEYIKSQSGGFSWNEITTTSHVMEISNGYVANNVSLVTLTLPPIANVGNAVIIQGKGAGLFRIAQNADQTIYFGSSSTTTGVSGYLEATNQYDSIQLVCITQNTEWAVLTAPQGALTIN